MPHKARIVALGGQVYLLGAEKELKIRNSAKTIPKFFFATLSSISLMRPVENIMRSVAISCDW